MFWPNVYFNIGPRKWWKQNDNYVLLYIIITSRMMTIICSQLSVGRWIMNFYYDTIRFDMVRYYIIWYYTIDTILYHTIFPWRLMSSRHSLFLQGIKFFFFFKLNAVRYVRPNNSNRFKYIYHYYQLHFFLIQIETISVQFYFHRKSFNYFKGKRKSFDCFK